MGLPYNWEEMLVEDLRRQIQRLQQQNKELKTMIDAPNEYQARQDALELLTAYAKDIVETWPVLTMRSLGSMTARVESLRQALEEVEKCK